MRKSFIKKFGKGLRYILFTVLLFLMAVAVNAQQNNSELIAGHNLSSTHIGFKLPNNKTYFHSSHNNFQKVNEINTTIHLQYDAPLDTIYIGMNLLYQTLFHGNIASDTVVLIASSNDQNNIPQYRLTGKLYSKDKYFSYTITDSALLNYENWSVSSGNNISYSPEGIVVKDFILRKDSASISMLSQLNNANSPLEIILQNFNLRNIASAFSKDTLLLEGLANGKIQLSELDKKVPAFTGTIEVNNMSVLRSFLGNVQLAAVRQNDSTINTTLTVSGNENDFKWQGNYYLNNTTEQFDGILDIKKFPLAMLQQFTKGYMSRATGNLSGLVTLNGTFGQPRWKGEIYFDTTKFGISQFGANYSINKQKVLLDYPFIHFSQFTIHDSLSSPLIMNGRLIACSAREYEIAIDLTARNFNLINASKAINNQLYGSAVIDADVSLTGTNAVPHMQGNILLIQNSDITMILPEKSVDKDAARTLVRFIDKDSFSFSEKETFRPLREPVANYAAFLNPDLHININKEAALTIVIDPSAGDELKVQGEANLTTGLDSGKNILAAGKYLLGKGYYELNYEFFKKRFNLLEGSAIQFDGTPDNAQINIKAEYVANTSPKELLGNEVGSVDPRIEKSFNQSIPFRVILYLNGSLMKPLVRFDIQLAYQEQISSHLRSTIQNKLIQLRADTAATNKQVFALLALDRFVGEQSTDFFKGNGGSFNDLASESVSRFLSDALDQIASDLFKGINIDLNLNSYKDFAKNSDEQKTDLNVEVSKSFLNDRLNVTVGKNFGIEGQDGSAKAAKQKGSRFLPDVTTNYKLSKDGKYMMKGYSKNQLEVILDGYVVETGLGFIVTLDYDKFNELFLGQKKGVL
ncbi:MAG: translocation/assembly module TamB domain-containing protein [Ferruginibacter sp.]